jgi:hypothetical protein
VQLLPLHLHAPPVDPVFSVAPSVFAQLVVASLHVLSLLHTWCAVQTFVAPHTHCVRFAWPLVHAGVTSSQLVVVELHLCPTPHVTLLTVL